MYTNIWDDTVPTGSEAANTIDDIFRSLKLDIEQRFIDIFAMPNFTADPLRPYGFKFTDAQDAVINFGDNSGVPRKVIFKDKTGGTSYITFGAAPAITIASGGLTVSSGSTSLQIVTCTGLTASGSITATLGVLTTVAFALNEPTVRTWQISVATSSGNLTFFSNDNLGNFLFTTNGFAVSATVANFVGIRCSAGIQIATTAIAAAFSQDSGGLSAATGIIRLASNATIMARNNANSADVQLLFKDANDIIWTGAGTFNGGFGIARILVDTAVNFSAGAAKFNGVTGIDSTNNRMIYYSGGNRYYLAGTLF